MDTLFLVLALHLSAHIALDGNPAEAAWQMLPAMHLAHHGEARIGYDDGNVYVGGTFQQHGAFIIHIGGLQYGVSDAGIRIDPMIAEDDRHGGRTYDTAWTSATSQHGKHWSAEMRIPYTMTKDTHIWVEFDDASHCSPR